MPAVSVVMIILDDVDETKAGTVGAAVGGTVPEGRVWNCVEADAELPNALVATLWTK
jgi:hypothetical protein